MTPNAIIHATGHYLPSNIVSNDTLATQIDTSDEWIFSRTGIKQRHIADDTETTSVMGTRAAEEALKNAELNPSDIDLIIVATTTPDHVFPSCATVIQHALGIHDCPAFDVQAVCSGFIYALDIANKFIKSGQAQHALVIGAEKMSSILDWTDRNTCVLFGDGAGAVVLSENDHAEGIINTKLFADGQYRELLWIPNGVSQQSNERTDSYVNMQGREVFKVAVSKLRDMVKVITEDTDYHANDIDKLVPHQANIRIIQSVAEKLDLPMEKVITTVAEHANTSAASVPLALHHGVSTGQIQRNELLLLEAFGGGFTWGGALIRY